MQHSIRFDQWLPAGGVYPPPADEGSAAVLDPFPIMSPLLLDVLWPRTQPAPDWAGLRERLNAICDPFDLLDYLGHILAQPAHPCDHTFTRTTAYFDQDPQQVLAMFQLFEELDVRCDCEAFFMLRVLTR
jgi:hypothetical protein